MHLQVVSVLLQEIQPGSGYPCCGTASGTSPHLACVKPARWHVILQRERPGSLLVPARGEKFCCDSHAYPVAQWLHCSFSAAEGQAALIADAVKMSEMGLPLR